VVVKEDQHEEDPGPDDAEVEKWLEEWAEVDRDAVDYLDDAMRAIGWEPVPGPDLDRAATALRDGATSNAAMYRYVVAELGGVDALPGSDRDLWVAAAAGTMAPADGHDDVEGVAAVFALQHADWLGLVLGLVRRGVGAVPDAEAALEDVEALDDIEGEIEDREGLVAVLAQAIDTLLPRWQALGILDEHGGLTRLGRWGLPVALRDTWRGPAALPPVDEELRRAARDALADKPRDLDSLRKALAKDHGIVEADELYRAVIADEDAWALPDGTYVHLPTLVEGLVLTHQLTAEEVALGALDDGADLALIGYFADEGIPLRGGGRLVVRQAQYGYDVPGPGPSSLAGPAGWLDGFEAGDALALRLSGGEVELEAAVFPDDPDADEQYQESLVTMVRTALALARANADDPEEGVGVWAPDLVLTLRRENPGIFDRALPPLGLLLAGVGMEVHDSLIGLPGTSWAGEPDWFDDHQRAAWRSWLEAISAAEAERLPERAQLTALAQALDDCGLVDYVQADLADSTAHAALVAAMTDATDGTLAAVPLLLGARLAELRGDGPQTLSLVEQAFATDPANEDAAAELADLRSIAGEAAEADRLYRVAGLDPLADEAVLVRRYLAPPAEGPGRNKPCPCGSGKKYKLCHGKKAVHPLNERAPWLWRKIQMFVQRGPNRGELLDWAGLLAGTDPDSGEAVARAMGDPTTQDFATFDGGLLDRFLAEWGWLLPSDERALAEEWRACPRRLMEVQEVRRFRGLVTRDLVSDETVEIVDKTMSRTVSVKDLLLGRPLPDGAGALCMQTDPMRVPRMLRAPLLNLMRAGTEGAEIASFFAPKGDPEVRTPEGHELVDSTARYVLTEADRVWSELAGRYDDDGRGGLVVLSEHDSVRGQLRRDGDQLTLRAMSIERLRSLQDVVTELDPGAVLVDVSSVPFGPAWEGRQAGAGGPEQAAPELSAEDMAGIARTFEQRWLAQEIPALGGMTPQDAAAGERRADLIALLDDFEWTQREHPQPLQMDIDRLRRELGLA
jgi:hypothetical protein